MIAAPVQPRRFTDLPPRLRRRILVSAYAISPVRGSEPGVGWHICSRLAQWHDVTVLCSPGVPGPDANYFRNEIAEHVRQHGPVPGLTIRFVEPPLLSKLFQRESVLCRRTLYYTGYAAWQRRAFRVAAGLHRNQPFDLVHQLNITGFREPGYLWKLDAPFVWGPIGGAPSFPSAYFDLLGRNDRLYYGLRNLTNRFQKSSARCRAAAAKARHIWAISAEDADMVERHWHHFAERMLETGATARDQGRVRSYDGTRPLRLAWCGQHTGRKALPILLHALARLKIPVEVTVIGDGPAGSSWRLLAESLGLKRIIWAGHVAHKQALAEVGRADVLAFTSVLEGTPHVVLEALSLGVPVICHDACGMGVAVTEDCGIRIPMHNSNASIAGFTEAMGRLAANPAEVVRLSRGALRRAAELDWGNKAERIVETYERVMDLAPVACGFAIP